MTDAAPGAGDSRDPRGQAERPSGASPPPGPSQPSAAPTVAASPAPAAGGLERLRAFLSERRRRLARALLVFRYVAGYLAAGFLTSVPISIGSRIGYGVTVADAVRASALSCGYGVVLLVPFFALIPLTRIDWREMRVPEFQLFELSVARASALASGALFCLSLLVNPTARPGWIEPGIFWTVFVLMALAWGKIKLQTLIFPEFYLPRKEDEPR